MRLAGFSFLELLVSLVIVGVLVSIFLPKALKFKLQAYNSNALYDLRNLISDELSYFCLTGNFVAFSVNDVNNKGIVKKGNFEHKYLSNDILAVAKVSGDYANFCTKHLMGDKIFGYQSETGAFYYKKSFPGYQLKDKDCPNASENNDFQGWKVLSQLR